MSMTKGTPASSQIIAMENMVAQRDAEIERLREAIISMRPMLDKKRIAWKKHADYLDTVLTPNVQIEGRAAFGAPLSNAGLGMQPADITDCKHTKR